MRITPDTNILVRAAVPVSDPTSEDGIQSAQARAILHDAEVIAITFNPVRIRLGIAPCL